MKTIRVFPRRTSMTPIDEDVRINSEPGFFDEADEVHVSCLFSYDRERAQQLAEAWSKSGFNVKLGGVAYGSPSEDFIPGMYVRRGAVITSRGCPNRCWFCNVWRKEGALRELPIKDGYILLDNNILACSEAHIKAVFSMLKRQKERALLVGGLEAKVLKDWHCDLIKASRVARMYFAYDTADDRDPFISAMKMLDSHGVSRSSRYCYCLIGYKGDTFEADEKRLREIWHYGAMPYAMLYRDEIGNASREWRVFQRQFSRPAIAKSILENRSKIIKCNTVCGGRPR